HEEISFWGPGEDEQGGPVVVSPGRPDFDVRRLLAERGTTLIMPAEGYVLRPWAFVLGWTEELVRLPHTSRLAARVEGRSTLARVGVGIHFTAPTIHAGFGFVAEPEHLGTRIRLGDLELRPSPRLPREGNEGVPAHPRRGAWHAGQGLRGHVRPTIPGPPRTSADRTDPRAADTPTVRW